MNDAAPISPVESPPSSSSLFSRLTNVFAAPSDVFDEVKASPPCTANWLVPSFLVILLSWVSVTIIFSQPNVNQQIRDVQEQAIRKRAEKMHMSQKDTEQLIEATEKYAGIGSKIAGYAAPPFAVFVALFIWAAVIWLLGVKVFKGTFPFMKAVEVVGLSSMIGVLTVIVKTLLIVVTGSIFATASPALLLKNYDPQNTLHAALGVFDVMGLWGLAVMAIGLARLSGVSFAKAVACVFGLWAALMAAILGFGAAMRAVFGG